MIHIRKDLVSLIAAGSTLIAVSNMLTVLATPIDPQPLELRVGDLPSQELSPLEKFQIANLVYQTFFGGTIQQVNEQLGKYSTDWISKPDILMQAEAYHQYAFTSYAKIITSEIENCNRLTGGGPLCQSMAIIEYKLEDMGSKKTMPAEYGRLITDAKNFSDMAIKLNPNEQRYKNLNSKITYTNRILSGK